MRILLADDHQMLRDLIASHLKPMGYEVLTAGSLPEAVDRIESDADFNLILLDLEMPGMAGLIGLTKITQNYSGIPVAILSGNTDCDMVFTALKRGAKGFIPKALGVNGLVSAIQVVLAGDRYVPQFLIEEMEQRLSASSSEAPEPNRQLGAPFTTQERDVLLLLKQGISNKMIGRSLKIEEYTVKHHLRRIFKKLGVDNRTQAVTLAIKENLP